MGIHERKEGFRNGAVTQPMSSQLTTAEHMELDRAGAERGGSCAEQRGPAPRAPSDHPAEVQRPAATAGSLGQPSLRPPEVCLSLEVTCIGRKHWKWSVLRAL